MRDEEMFGCLATVIIIVLAVALVCGESYLGCKKKAKMQGMECSWGPFQGCMVKTEKGWIDYERLRYMGEYDVK